LFLQIGIANVQLQDCYSTCQVQCAAYITAWNPYSEATDLDQNRRLQSLLAVELKTMNLHFFEGIGQHSSGTWPGEESFLVLGLKLNEAISLGNKYRQNAIVWCDRDAIPKLILLR